MKYLKVEFLRSWFSFTMFLPLVVIIAAGLAFSLQQSGVANGLPALHFYPVGLLMPIALVTPVVANYREQKFRSGGTQWRPQNIWAMHAARLVVATFYAGIGHLLAPMLLVGFSPTFFILETLVFAGGYGIGLLLWQLLNRAAVVSVPLVAIAFVVLSFFAVDSDHWYLNPFCWSLRPTLPIFGVEANSTLAAPDSHVRMISPVWPTLAHIIFGAVCFCAAAALAGRKASQGSASIVGRVASEMYEGNIGDTVRISRPRSLALGLPWRVFGVFALVMWSGLGFARWSYGTDISAALYGLIVVPLIPTVVGIMGWNAHKDAWRNLVTRPDARRLFPTLLGLLFVFTTVVLLLGGLVAGAVPYQLIVTPGITAVILAITLLCTVASLGLTLTVALFALIWGIVVGGSSLAESPLWWHTGPWAWTWVVHEYPERWYEVFFLPWIVFAILVRFASRRMSRRTKE